jgi:hypothetical protein
VRLSIARDSALLELPVRVGTRNLLDYEIVSTSHVTEAQRTRRMAWMRGEAETAEAH